MMVLFCLTLLLILLLLLLAVVDSSFLRILRVQSHFTEGFEFHPLDDEVLVECTGLKRSSVAQAYRIPGHGSVAGASVGTGTVEAEHALDDKFFGEGCTVFGDRLYVYS